MFKLYRYYFRVVYAPKGTKLAESWTLNYKPIRDTKIKMIESDEAPTRKNIENMVKELLNCEDRKKHITSAQYLKHEEVGEKG